MLNRLRYRVAIWRRDRAAIRNLRNLDDHLLADIGADRGSIQDFVRGCVRKSA